MYEWLFKVEKEWSNSLAVMVARVRFLPSAKAANITAILRWFFLPLGIRWYVTDVETDSMICVIKHFHVGEKTAPYMGKLSFRSRYILKKEWILGHWRVAPTWSLYCTIFSCY